MKPVLYIALFLGIILSSFAQEKSEGIDFKPGYYYTKAGNRVNGFIKHTFGRTLGNSPDNFIDFKLSPQASKVERFTVHDIHDFVIGQDSFTVKKNFAINDYENYDQDFVQIVKTGEINLYLHYSTQSQKTILSYLVEKTEEIYPMARTSKFNDQIIILIADHKDLLKKIKTKEYKLDKLSLIVAEYNQWYAQKMASL